MLRLRATLQASTAQPEATIQVSGSFMTSPIVRSVTAQVPEKHTLQMSFSQIILWMSSKASVLKPPDSQVSFTLTSRSVMPPFISPSRRNSMPL